MLWVLSLLPEYESRTGVFTFEDTQDRLLLGGPRSLFAGRCRSWHCSDWALCVPGFVACIQKQPKSKQPSIQNLSKIIPKATQNRSWGCPGGLSEASWSPFPTQVHTLGAREAFWRPTGLQLGSPKGARIAPKSRSKTTPFAVAPEITFFMTFGPQNGGPGPPGGPPFLEVLVLAIFEGCPQRNTNFCSSERLQNETRKP